jgi:hypothetical protein
MNLLPSAAPAQAPCGKNPPPADKRPNATLAIGLTFYRASASAPLAAADFGSVCDVVKLTIGNRPEQDLIPNFPGVQASRYEFLITGLVTDFAPLPGAAGARASTGASAVH